MRSVCFYIFFSSMQSNKKDTFESNETPFNLVSSFEPRGDQPGAIRRIIENLEAGVAYQTLLGVTGSGKTFTMANVIAELGKPSLILAPNKTLAAQLYSEMRDFFPSNAVEYFVSYYDYYQPEAYVPQRDLFLEKDSAINEHIEQMRLSATKSLLTRKDTIIVASVSCIYGIGDPENYNSMILALRINDKITRSDVIAKLVSMQYMRNDLEFSRGKFRVRGEHPTERFQIVLLLFFLLEFHLIFFFFFFFFFFVQNFKPIAVL